MTDLGGTLDVLSSLRGAEQLLFDLIENPDRVRQWSEQITAAWLESFRDFNSVISPYQEGTGGWMGLSAPGRWFPLQCDFANMISPAMFERFVVPDLRRVAGELDFTIYHWEVPGQFPHLDLLLSIPEIDGISGIPARSFPRRGTPRGIRSSARYKPPASCWSSTGSTLPMSTPSSPTSRPRASSSARALAPARSGESAEVPVSRLTGGPVQWWT